MSDKPEVVEAEIVSEDENVALAMRKEDAALAVAHGFNPDRSPNQSIPEWILDRIEGGIDLTDEQIRILTAPLDPRSIRMKQNVPYLPWQEAANRFDQAFGNGHWAVIPISKITVDAERTTNNGGREVTVVQQWALFIDGKMTHYIVTSDHKYYPDSPNQIMPQESLKSSAYFRILKALGGGRELNDSEFVNAWKKKYSRGVPVFIDGEDVFNAYKTMLKEHDKERVKRLLTDYLGEDGEKLAGALAEQFGDAWPHLVMRHVRGKVVSEVARRELNVLAEYLLSKQFKHENNTEAVKKDEEADDKQHPKTLAEALAAIAIDADTKHCTGKEIIDGIAAAGVQDIESAKAVLKSALGIDRNSPLGEDGIKRLSVYFKCKDGKVTIPDEAKAAFGLQ